MEDQYVHSTNGQSVLQADLNTLGEVSALADDRVLAELFRMAPFDGSTVRKGILSHGHAASGITPLVETNGASGSVKVNPFRAIVGTRTAVTGDDAKKNWRDIRSAIAVGSTTLHQVVSLSANASGNPRWDLIYAAVAVDANTAAVARKIKDPSTESITEQLVVTRKATTVTLGVQAGTAAASPDWPSVPSDAAGTYYIPIAYVRVPNGFGASSTVADTDIAVVAPCLPLARATGGAVCEPGNSHNTIGDVIDAAAIQSWGSSGTRPKMWMPPTMGGMHTLMFAFDLTTSSESHASGDTIDTRDWRNRVCRWTAAVVSTLNDFAWVGGDGIPVVDMALYSATTNEVAVGVGNTFSGSTPCVTITGTEIDNMVDSASLNITADGTTGELVLTYSGAPNCKIFLWLEFSGPYENA